MNALFYAHSGLRYLVLLAGIAAVLYLAFALATGRDAERPGKILTSAFVGLLDLQIVLGVLLVATGLFYPALMGHLVMMLLAAAVGHWAAIAGKRAADRRYALRVRLIGVSVALVLIVGGIMAIGRSLFGSGTPSMGA